MGVLFPPKIAQLAHLDFSLIGLTLLVAVAATLLAAFYPAWRAAHVQPAWCNRSRTEATTMSLHIKPILAALRRHKAGTLLIVLQIALTLAIVCNALFIIHQRLSSLAEVSGVDEANVFVIRNQWAIIDHTTQQVDAQVRADLLALRQLPGVQDASPPPGYPLQGGGWDNYVMMSPDQVEPTTDSAVYVSDEHFIGTLGLRLVAGRNFRTDEVIEMGTQQAIAPPVVIVSKALADRLFPHGDALGKNIYAMSTTPSTIIGVVDPLHRQGTSLVEQGLCRTIADLAGAPRRRARRVLHRARQAGPAAAAMREAPMALYAQSRMRIIDPKDGIQDYAEVRRRAYESDRGTAILMGIICAVLLAITAAGIVGLTSFWVGQRRRQIGIRRALGATRHDILGYFLTENFLIGVGGVVVGVGLAVVMNLSG